MTVRWPRFRSCVVCSEGARILGIVSCRAQVILELSGYIRFLPILQLSCGTQVFPPTRIANAREAVCPQFSSWIRQDPGRQHQQGLVSPHQFSVSLSHSSVPGGASTTDKVTMFSCGDDLPWMRLFCVVSRLIPIVVCVL